MFCSQIFRGEGDGEESPALLMQCRGRTKRVQELQYWHFFVSHRQEQLSQPDVELCEGMADMGNNKLWSVRVLLRRQAF